MSLRYGAATHHPAQCAHVAALARLELTDEELDRFTGQLDELLDHVAEVEALDVEGLAPTMHALPLPNLLRPDTRARYLTATRCWPRRRSPRTANSGFPRYWGRPRDRS